ncbi:translation initiation factor IF-2-like [Zalophus californianus]|uniref:Translation initiation factor IF-2-like n=1 Tax=Zalophus californianus TaxID=9704 RepID=A0A6J2BHJ6_ZALCA|nr:translation initiation factor IF-2-like [Zalophus californianus]
MFLRQETQGPKLVCTPGPELHTTVVVHQEARSDPGVHAGAALLTTMVSHEYLPRRASPTPTPETPAPRQASSPRPPARTDSPAPHRPEARPPPAGDPHRGQGAGGEQEARRGGGPGPFDSGTAALAAAAAAAAAPRAFLSLLSPTTNRKCVTRRRRRGDVHFRPALTPRMRPSPPAFPKVEGPLKRRGILAPCWSLGLDGRR